MAGTQIRLTGTTATYAPVIKRGVATLTDGRVVALVVDSNLATAAGTDVTGVAKIHLYVSNDTTRTAFTLAASYTPTVAPSSSTRAARAALTVGADNSVWVAWQGVDNSLNVSRWSYSAGALTFVANEVVVAASAVTDRFRALDIDVLGNASAMVGAYEANAATGSGSWHRVYIRMNSASWLRAVNSAALATGQFIRNGSEDISIAWWGGGLVSNSGRFVIYGTKTHTTGDLGDLLREYSFNVSTGTTDSATTNGTWYTAWNKDQASGTRRAIFFTISSTIWVCAQVLGAGVPRFTGVKLTSQNYAAPTINAAGYVSTTALANYFKIDPSANNRTYWSATYKDNRLIFGFAGIGTTSAPRIFREVSMAWPNVGTITAKPTVDLVPRPLDSATYANGGPIAIYGGDNKRLQSSLNTYNFIGIYGPSGNTTGSTLQRAVRFVNEDTFDAPALVAPYNIEPTNRPIYRVRVENVNLQPNLYGKIEVNIATNSTFTTGLKTIIEDDSKLRYFGSKDGLTGGVTQVAVPTASPTQALVQGTWYWRARVVSDKGTAGAWSSTFTFTVSHPPTANPIYPPKATVVPYTSGNSYTFSWTRSDTEPTDTQTAYRIIVRRLDTLANVVDTGFVSSSSTTPNITIDAVSLGILETPLDWSVQLKDADGVTGPASVQTEFTIGTIPTMQITAPSTGVPIDTALPTVTWSYSSSGGRAQKAYRVSIYDNTVPNLLSNASFETGDLTGWTFYSGTAAVVGTEAHSGQYSAQVTPNGSGASPRVERIASTPVIEGEVYVAEAWIKCATSGPNAFVGINWNGSGGTYISTSSVSVTPTPGAWQKVIVTATPPAGALTASPHAGRTGTPAVGDIAYVDDISFHGLAPVDDDPIVTTGWRVGTDTSYTFSSQVLVNTSPYRIVVEVQDIGGLVATDEVAINTAWNAPLLPGGQLVTAPDKFKVRVTWTDANRDPDFLYYRVYRRYMKTSIAAFDLDNSASTWYMVYETSDMLTNYTFDDYLAPLNKPIDYIVVQVVDRFGSLIESTISGPSTITLSADRYYFVPEVNLGGVASFEAAGVTGDNFTRDVEQESLHVVGRGRQMQVGDDLGYSGTMTIHLRNPSTARRDREFFEIVSSQYNKVYVKTPFGDVVLIALGNVQTTRQAGYGGYADFADLNVPYMEIIDESLVPRQVS